MLNHWNDLWADFDRTFAWMQALQQQMDRAYQLPARNLDMRASRGLPNANLYDTGSEFVVRAEVPGLGQKDVNVSVNQDVLTISGVRQLPTLEDYSVHRRERPSVRFSRSFSFPAPVDMEKAQATVKDGILTVRLAKAQEAQPRQITVKAE